MMAVTPPLLAQRSAAGGPVRYVPSLQRMVAPVGHAVSGGATRCAAVDGDGVNVGRGGGGAGAVSSAGAGATAAAGRGGGGLAGFIGSTGAGAGVGARREAAAPMGTGAGGGGGCGGVWVGCGREYRGGVGGTPCALAVPATSASASRAPPKPFTGIARATAQSGRMVMDSP
ncbi:MAG TPA: hypothetical protein VMV51_07825 [Gemmatimonadaceae bacterium]|nr:hypothetical protein [Gemmatimonadaceae bacterium]